MRLFRHPRRAGERGAVAVEFALIVPVLILMLVGLIEFSRAFNAQISITNAAREAARTMAIENNVGLSKSVAINAAVLNPAIKAGQIAISPSTCAPQGTVRVTISYNLVPITGFFGLTIPMQGVGVMRCGG